MNVHFSCNIEYLDHQDLSASPNNRFEGNQIQYKKMAVFEEVRYKEFFLISFDEKNIYFIRKIFFSTETYS